MIKLTSIFLLFTSLIFSSFVEAGQVRAQCASQTPNDPVLYSSDFKWGYEFKEMMNRSEEIYVSPKRLSNRAYYDTGLKTYVMNVNADGKVKKIRLPSKFLEAVRTHIEVSLKRHYADAVFFPDMGHSHFFVSPKDMEELNKIDFAKDKNLFYERLFSLSGTKILYHTAEQLKVKDGDFLKGTLSQDPYLQWRYYSRNVIGQNDGSDNVSIVFAFGENYNTIRDLDGYNYFGAGYNVSANQNGCFEFTKDGKTFYFDLSMDDLVPDPSQGGGYTDAGV